MSHSADLIFPLEPESEVSRRSLREFMLNSAHDLAVSLEFSDAMFHTKRWLVHRQRS